MKDYQSRAGWVGVLALLLAVGLTATGCGTSAGGTESEDTSHTIVSQISSPSTPSSLPEASSFPEKSPETSSDSISQSVPPPSDGSSQSSRAPSFSEPPVPSSDVSSQVPVVQDDFFDDAVFIGDSVTLKLKYYTMKQRDQGTNTLGQAQFLTSGNMGCGNALQPVSADSIHPTYQGNKLPLGESVAKSKAKKVYIMLGMNDIGLYGLDQSLSNMDKLIGQILEQSPDASIYIQSVTPILKGHEKKVLNNENIRKYNEMLSNLCADKGYTFVDVSSVLTDSEGYLPAKFCSDADGMGIHFTDLACSVWVEYLYAHI